MCFVSEEKHVAEADKRGYLVRRVQVKEASAVSRGRARGKVGRALVGVALVARHAVRRKNGSAYVRLDWLDDRDERFGVHHFSDGTLRGIALITAFAQPTNSLPRWMSIDEPELGLHPKAIRMVAELARFVSRHTQILFATQSSTFLDLFEPEEIVVVEREKGASLLKRLDAADLVG